jgi:type I restriction enzyme S subunit
MKLETFFEKFEQFAEAPNAVAKMRELVLQLAVQEKLVEQRPGDGSATDLIEHSQNERNRLLKEKRMRNSQSITPLSEWDTAGSLPKTWAWTTLAEISEINPRNDIEDDALATFIPMPGIPQTYRGSLGGEIRPWGEIKKSFTHFADGDIALAKITPCFQNGKSAVFRGLKNGIGAGTTELHVARPIGESVLPEYVWIFLKSPLFISEGIPAMTGSAGQKRVPTGYFALKPFPLPPLAEQKRIVAKVDELMALCDRLEAQYRERDAQHTALARASLARFADAPTPANLTFLFDPSYTITPADLRKTILTLAVQGKLVPQDVNGEPAEEFITTVRNAALESGYRGRTNSEDDNNPKFAAHVPDDLPPGWSVCPLEDLFRFIDYRGRTPVRRPSGVRLITAKNVKKGFISNEPVEFIDEDVYPKWMTRGFPKKGDLLFVTEGHTMGFVGTLNFDFKYALAQRTIDLQPFCDADLLQLLKNNPAILNRYLPWKSSWHHRLLFDNMFCITPPPGSLTGWPLRPPGRSYRRSRGIHSLWRASCPCLQS